VKPAYPGITTTSREFSLKQFKQQLASPRNADQVISRIAYRGGWPKTLTPTTSQEGSRLHIENEQTAAPSSDAAS
jgi:hypothetical protein